MAADFPVWNPEYLKEDAIKYPVQFNGKVRLNLSFPAEATKDEIAKAVLEDEQVQKWIDGNEVKKLIVVPKRIINVVI